MSNPYKPGGGNKPQPYIPAGNGEKSGEYTNKASNTTIKREERYAVNLCIKNIKFGFNFYHSKLVKRLQQQSFQTKAYQFLKYLKQIAYLKK